MLYFSENQNIQILSQTLLNKAPEFDTTVTTEKTHKLVRSWNLKTTKVISLVTHQQPKKSVAIEMRYVLVIFTTLNVIFVSSSGDIYFPASSSVCKFGEKCIPFTECETAITAWKHKKTMMKTCCFKGKIQYVCCPDSQMEPMKSDLQTNVFVKPPAIYSEVEPPKSDNLHYGNPINIDIKASTETLSDKSKFFQDISFEDIF